MKTNTTFTNCPETTLLIRKPYAGFDGLTLFGIGIGLFALTAIMFISIADMFSAFAF